MGCLNSSPTLPRAPSVTGISPSMSTRTSLVCVLDAGVSVGSKLDVAKALLANYSTQKMMSSKTFEMSIVTYGSGRTRNHLNDRDADQYIGVDEVYPLRALSPDMLQSLRTIQVGQEAGDMIDGVAVGYSILTSLGKRKTNRYMLLITDGETAIDGMEDLEALVNAMAQDVDDIKYNQDEERIKTCIVLVAFIGDSQSDTSTIYAKENAKLLRNIASLTGGIFVEGQSFEDLLPIWEFRGLGTRPMQTKIVFELSSSVKIPCVQWMKVSKQTFPSLKKESDSFDGTDAETGNVKRDTSYLIPSLEDQECRYEDRVKGYRYGSTFVPIMNAEQLMAIEEPPGIRLVGFMAAEKVRRHHFLETPIVVQGAPFNQPAQSAVISLARYTVFSQFYNFLDCLYYNCLGLWCRMPVSLLPGTPRRRTQTSLWWFSCPRPATTGLS